MPIIEGGGGVGTSTINEVDFWRRGAPFVGVRGRVASMESDVWRRGEAYRPLITLSARAWERLLRPPITANLASIRVARQL